MKDPAFPSSPIYPPILLSKPSFSTKRDEHLIPILSHDRFIFKSQLTSLYVHATDYTFKLDDKNQDFSTSIESKVISPYQYGLKNGVNIFSLKFNCHRPSIFVLKTDKIDPTFLSVAQKVTHHQIKTKFLQYKKPQNYIFANYK